MLEDFIIPIYIFICPIKKNRYLVYTCLNILEKFINLISLFNFFFPPTRNQYVIQKVLQLILSFAYTLRKNMDKRKNVTLEKIVIVFTTINKSISNSKTKMLL